MPTSDERSPSALTIRISDPFSCMPARARRNFGMRHTHPYWRATTTEPAITHGPLDWQLQAIESVKPRCHVSFRRKQSTFSFLSRKSGFSQSGESAWEYYYARELEVNPFVVDYQFHGAKLRWKTADGPREYGPDCHHITVEAKLTMTEIKASQSYFAEPEYRALMRLTHDDLAKAGIRFEKVTGDQLLANRRRTYNISRAFDDRFTAFHTRDVNILRDGFLAEGPELALARVGELLGLPGPATLPVVNAMMCCRHLAYDLDEFVSADTIIRTAPQSSAAIRDIRSLSY